MERNVLTLSLVISISVTLIISCNTQKSDWEITKQQNTLKAYNSFIKKYTEKETQNSVYMDSAKFHINILQLENAKTKNNLQAYYDYLIQTKDYEVDSFKKIVNNKIDSLRYDSVNEIGTEDAYSSFYKNYPNSYYYKKAKHLSRDTILTGRLVILLSFPSSDGYLLILETKRGKYDINLDKDCQYINIESQGDTYIFNTNKLHEVGGRIYRSIDLKTVEYYSNQSTVKASYIKCL